MLLPDINVWLAAAWFLAAEPETCCFCRLTQQGFLRLATTPKIMTRQALSLREAWQAYDDLYNDPRGVFVDEPGGIEPLWRKHTQRNTFSPKVWNDA